MKKFLALLGLTALSTTAFAASPIISPSAQVQALISSISPLDLITWKVGDTANYDVSAGTYGKLGTDVKKVTKDDGATIWIEQDMDLSIQKQSVEIQMNKADGKVLKTIVNGQEQTTPDDPITIVSQDYTSVTVPAGTFKAIHVVAKSAKIDHIEVWANPQATVMDGALKQVITTQGVDIDMELTSFSHGH